MSSVLNRNYLLDHTRLNSALEMAGIGLWELDLSDANFWINERFQSHFESFGASIISYKDMLDLVHPEDSQYMGKLMNAILLAGSNGDIDIEIRTKAGHQGTVCWLNWKGQVYFSDDGSPFCISGIVQEITNTINTIHFEQQQQSRHLELEMLNQELEILNEEYIASNEELAKTNMLLFESNQNLQQFANVASHDLQEPLRKIHSFGNLLRTHLNDNPQAGSYMDKMQSAAKRMSNLIEDLLCFSRVSSTGPTISRVELNQVIEEVISDLEINIQKSAAVINIRKLPVIKGDASQLARLFQNLLSNAIKFRRKELSPEIEVTWEIVHASTLPDRSNADPAVRVYDRINIIDNGIGFDPKDQDRIFKVFQRLHGISEFEGSGIGLAICEKVAASHGGFIKVESRIGTGSTFSVYFPITG